MTCRHINSDILTHLTPNLLFTSCQFDVSEIECRAVYSLYTSFYVEPISRICSYRIWLFHWLGYKCLVIENHAYKEYSSKITFGDFVLFFNSNISRYSELHLKRIYFKKQMILIFCFTFIYIPGYKKSWL